VNHHHVIRRVGDICRTADVALPGKGFRFPWMADEVNMDIQLLYIGTR
jgi:hypothetical protein